MWKELAAERFGHKTKFFLFRITYKRGLDHYGGQAYVDMLSQIFN
jgi:hypothetical protein